MRLRTLRILAVIATFGCHNARPHVGDPGAKTPVGSWEGVVSATSTDVANATGQTLNVSVVIEQSADGWSGRCSQSAGKAPTIKNSRIQSFEFKGVDPAGGVVALGGKCGGRTFTLAYHPTCDQISLTWLNLKYFGTGLTCAPNSGLNRTKESTQNQLVVPSSTPPPWLVEQIAGNCPAFRAQFGLVKVASCSVTEFGEFASFHGDTYYYSLYCVEGKGSNPRYNGSCDDADFFNSSYGMSRSNIGIFVRHGADHAVRLVLERYDSGGPYRTPNCRKFAGTVMELPLVIAASCDCNASGYYLWRPRTGDWALMDWESWQHEAERKFPPNLTNQNGYWPDLRTLTTDGALWRPDDAHCCPSGGSVSVQPGIVESRFVLRALDIKVSEREQPH